MRSETGVGPTGPALRWFQVFRRSRLSPQVFVVADSIWEQLREVLDSSGLPSSIWSSMFSDFYRSTVVLDGLVLWYGPYGFPAGRLSRGWRVVGCRPMRLLCVLLGVEVPLRRLQGENAIPSTRQLREALRLQLEEPRVNLEERARAGLGVADAESLLRVVTRLFGD
jgi:hypothetical protein